jgi:hypothetical protein
MKNFIAFLFAASIFTVSVDAQITINKDDVKALGTLAIQGRDTLPIDASIQAGGTGSQVWDFTALKPDLSFDYEFVNPSGTPYESEFPDANLCAIQDKTFFLYLKESNQRIDFLGAYVELGTGAAGDSVAALVKLSPANSVIRFPAKFGDTYTETNKRRAQVKGSAINFPVDSVRLISTITRVVNIDAFGEMKIPAGNFDVIRSTEAETGTDSIFVYTLGQWSFFFAQPAEKLITYNWWTNENGLGFPLVSLEFSVDSNRISELNFFKEFVTGIEEVSETFPFQLYPSPASEWITLAFPDMFAGSLEVYDFNGRLSLSRQMKGFSEKIDLRSMPVGAYVVVLKNEQGKMMGFRRFEVVRP